MNPWLNDNATPNNHAGFAPHDPSTMAFMQPPNTINPAQFQNPAFLNGAPRTASPAFHNPMYQTNPVIPSKRTREDSLGTSPRQAPNALPGSRSQTPGQGAFPGFNPQQPNGGQFPNAPTPFQHLQTSNNASPSPTIQQNNFPQAGVPRVSTASPSPFSPQHGGPQMSPGPGDQNSRVGTPHDNVQNFMNPAAFGQGFGGQQFNPNMMNQVGMGPMNMAQQQMQQQPVNMAQRNYQMQLQAQARQMQAQAQAQRANGMQNPMAQQPNPITRPTNPEEFLRSLQTFMTSRGQTFEPAPVIGGRPIQLMRLYGAVMKAGGSARLSKMNSWPLLAQQFQFPPPQIQHVGQEMHNYWMQNLAAFESAMMASQQQRHQRAMAAQGQVSGQMPGRPQGQDPSGNQQQSLPPQQLSQQHQQLQQQQQQQHQQQQQQQHQQQQQQQQQQHHQQQQHQQLLPPQQQQQQQQHQRQPSDMMNMKMNGQIPPSMNGFAQGRDQNDQTPTASHRGSTSRQLDPAQLNGLPISSPSKRPQTATLKVEPEPEPTMPLRKPIEDPFKPDILPESRYHGPINVDEMFIIGQHILDLKPVQPTLRELGVIDIHALTMAIKSGMHAEARVALDTLVALSTESSLQLNLVECDDLMETLIDYAQDQVSFLGEHATEVSDDLSLSSYEDVVRACRIETETLQEVSEFSSLAYDLDRAADRLVCITTLIRNFSFYEANFLVLGQPEVLQLLSNVIRQLGMKELPLRTHRNTLDFMKDIVIYLSNLSTSLQIPGKQEALSLMHFLLAFAPNPAPVSSTFDKISFTMYNPNLHKYLPPAVDSLAKLLARDEPNRMYYKSIFNADAKSTPPYELLTRAFGLSIAATPTTTANKRAVIEARKPFLLQGMLAAEILATMAPGSENPLVRSWLESEDSFAGNLLHLVSLLSSQTTAQRQAPPPQHNRHGMPLPPENDPHAYGALTHRAMAVLKLLVQKARILDRSGSVVLPHIVALKKETLLGAMIQKDIDPGILRQLCSYAGMED